MTAEVQSLPPVQLQSTEGIFDAGACAGSWTVLFFYPKDLSPGCTTEAQAFSEMKEEFERLGARVFGISPDGLETHRRFIQEKGLSVPLVSDPDHLLMEPCGAWGEKVLYGKKVLGVKRSTLLLSPDGTVAHHWKAARAKDNAVRVLEKLKTLVAK